MITKEATHNTIKKAIQISFEGDSGIFENFDPLSKVETVNDVVENIAAKLKTFDKTAMKNVYEKDELIGYFVYSKDTLISFALTPKYRKRTYLRQFFQVIKNELGNHFTCLLWSRNLRALKWLMKNNLKVEHTNLLTTKLKYN